MTRPKLAKVADAASSVDIDALQTAGRAADQHHALVSTIDAQYGLGAPYNYDAHVAQIQLVISSTGQQLLEIGRLLVMIKEHETRERFEDALARTGLSRRFALKTMQAAVKFTGSESKQMLGSRLGSAKLLELMAEDDDVIEALADGGTVAGVSLDEIDRMSVRELKAALRAEREEHADEKETFNELLEKKNKKVDDLSKKLKKWDRSPVRDRAEELLRSVDEETVSAIAALNRLNDAINAVATLYADEGIAVEADIDSRLEQAARTASKCVGTIEQTAGIA